MDLQTGTKLGAYEILDPIGAGGMGQVYRARDTQLGREVAVKTLPASLLGDPERLARFEREARLLASLTHPCIAAIYDLERTDGGPALVMELVEGETLAERIARGPIPFDELTHIAKQIADALEAAHDRGIVHRDLKPANVKIRLDGAVKVLDFGLAKAIEPVAARTASGSGSASLSPTITSPAMTQAGMILGTAAYMSPEQAKARQVDERADIWAFGCVVYEMLTGRRAFGGEEVAETLAAVVLREPDWTALPPATPAGLRRLLRRCLAKTVNERLRHIGDARLDLLDRTDEGVARPEAPSSQGAWRVVGSAALVGLVLLAGFTTWQLWRPAAPVPGPVRFSVPTPPDFEFQTAWQAVEMSPDGSALVLAYTKRAGQLFIRRLSEDAPRPIAGVERGSRPFFSPDGNWLAFVDDNTLKKVSIDGGAVVTVTDNVDFGGGSWTRDDQLIYTRNYASGLSMVPSAGGPPQVLTEPDTGDGELGHFWPQVLPDDRHVLYTAFRTPPDTSRIKVFDRDTKTSAVVIDGGFYGRYVPSGHLLFTQSTNVMAVAFDAGRLQPAGQAVPVIPGVAVALPNGVAKFSVSSTGTLAYVSEAAVNVPRQLAWLDRRGTVTPVTGTRRSFDDARVSPDGRRIAVTITERGNQDVWVYDVARDTFSRLTSSPTAEFSPVWSPDGARIFHVLEEPVYHVYARASDGSGEAVQILGGPFDVIPRDVSPDGQFLVVRRSDPAMRGGLVAVPLAGKGELQTIVDSPFPEDQGRLSPDGRWMAYTSEETGRSEVYLRQFPDGGQRAQVSNAGGRAPRWSRDGRELFFLEVDRMMSASVRDGEIGRPVVLFERPIVYFEVGPDGRFLAILRDETAPPAPANVVVNWLQELTKAVPVK